MIIFVQINNLAYKIDCDNPLVIAIPLDFYGAQPNAYDVEKATSKPCQAEGLIGDTRHGGSCNFEQIKLIPHCNGTHTESIGHITNERISIHDCLRDAFVPATLVSVAPENAAGSKESYGIDLSGDDYFITRESLEKALQDADADFADGLIIRTLPNGEEKKSQIYSSKIPPFFSSEAMELIAEKSVRHLLVDTPSIDRIFDEGKLSNHRAFWNVAPNMFALNENSFAHKTITEMIYVPDEIADGAYLLNLQIAPFVADASPSRPIIFKIIGE